MNDLFGPEFFRRNRESITKLFSDSLILIAASNQLQRSADTTFNFRQDSSFWYFTGINRPDFILAIDQGDPYLVLPERESSRDLWEGALDIPQLLKQSGLKKVMSMSELKERIKSAKVIARPEPLPAHIAAQGFYSNPGRANLEKLIKKSKADKLDIRKNIARLRQVKQPEEVTAIQRAIDITMQTLADIKARLKSYKNEGEIARDLSVGFFSRGADGHAYEPIVASGRHATTLHYIDNNAPIVPNAILLIDAGAEYQGYAADITRGWPVGILTAKQALVLKIAKDVQEFAITLLKPGIILKAYEEKVHDFLANELVKRKVFNSLKEAQTACPHAISHFLGLDVHDAGDYEMPLMENMVMTVEPGIYLPKEGIGVRIEDNVVITKTGCKVLSQN